MLVNNSWCSAADIVNTHCCPDLELLTVQCRLFFLPREFTTISIMPLPKAKDKLALERLPDVIRKKTYGSPRRRDECSRGLQ